MTFCLSCVNVMTDEWGRGTAASTNVQAVQGPWLAASA